MIIHNNKEIAQIKKYCKNFSSSLKGLMFSKINKAQAIIIERKKESILNSSIHMLFVFQKLKIIWLNSNKEVVDIKDAYPFISLLKPKKPAKYILEFHHNNPLLNNIKIGDKLEF
jgi:uncharacterized membrane protein (UPF0127 family)